MKNRKRIITTLIGMTLTAQLSPVAYTVVNAQEPNVVQGQAQQEAEKKGLDANTITLGGNGCWENPGAGIHKVEIKFNTKDMKLSATALSGYPGSDHSFHEYCPGEYIVVELISGTTGRIKKHVAMSGKDNIQKLTNALNDTPFEYGDSLRIYHGEGMQRTTIKGPVLDKKGSSIEGYDTTGLSKDTLNNFQFVITRDGLKQVAQNIIEVDSTDELIKQLLHLSKCKHQATIKLTESIRFDDDDIKKLSVLNSKKELTIPEGTTLTGIENNIEINLNGQASLVLKGDYTGLQNITIKNSAKDGVQVYDSDYSSLKKVSVTGSKGYGIFSNGSTVAMEGCKTSKNEQGGVLISTSLDIQLRKKKFSNVTFKTDTNKFTEPNHVVIKNLELIRKSDSSQIREKQNNTFKIENNKMGKDIQSGQYKSQDHDEVKDLNRPIYEDVLKQFGIDTNDIQVKEYYKIYKF